MIMIIEAHWYDAAAHRRVEFFVDYSIIDNTLDINDVWPTAVSFLNRETGKVNSSIGVHTETGRDLLITQLFDSGEAYNLTLELARRYGLLAVAD